MYDSTRLPMLTPEALRGAPAPSEPVRFSLRDTPERQRNDLYRDFFGRSVMRYEVEPSRNIPFDIDVKLQILPGLLMVTGKMHGSDNRRTRECLADGLDDLAMAVNMGGSYVVRQGEDEIVLGNGEATLFSLGRPCRLVHQPPGHFLALRFPRSQSRRASRVRTSAACAASAPVRRPCGCSPTTSASRSRTTRSPAPSCDRSSSITSMT